jgi:lipopolysaccharide transport system ATP-binding protein
MSIPAVIVSGLTKRYQLGARENYPTIRETIARATTRSLRRLRSMARRGRDEDAPAIWALQGVDLDVQEGEVFGIIGRNGSGKSTLLKILAGITEPTSGYADICGRVGSLLEIGTGFHMELTGRENIAMNGALLGMRRREIVRKFDEIVAFSEVEAFLDTPVKRYSSGMYMRLAFSVAAHLEPDILIVDEVLAVGDVAFQKKCLGKMTTVAREGRTVLFVSHNMATVQSLCTRVALLDHGRVVQVGQPQEVIGRYLQTVATREAVALELRPDRRGDGSVRMVSVEIESMDPDRVIRCGSRLVFTVRYRSAQPLRYASVIVGVSTLADVGAFVLDSETTGGLPEVLPAEGVLRCITAPINLTPGRCFVALRLKKGGVDADFVKKAAEFDVESDDFFGTGKLPAREWSLLLLHHEWSQLAEPPAQ